MTFSEPKLCLYPVNQGGGKGLSNSPWDSRLVIKFILWRIRCFKCQIKKLHKMASDQNLRSEEIWENPPSQWLPNHSILLHSEPKIHQQIFIEHPLCANITMNVQRKYGPYHRSLYSLVVQTGHVQMTRQKPHRWHVTLTTYWCDSMHAVCWREAF